MRILVSNDDGYLAPGIIALANELAKIAEIAVVAPDSNRSASSNSLTLHRPISVYEASNGYYYTNGTPSDCVHIAVTGNHILPWKPDLIVSGINHGENMGDDTLYSGTVAAATEGFLFGIPAIAFSQVERGWKEIESAAKVARDIVERVYQSLPKPFLLNVNIPNLPYAELQSVRATRLGKRHQSAGVIQQQDPYGQEIFWIGRAGAARDASEGTDFHAIQNGHVSITPLQIDLTHDIALGDLRKALDE